MRVQHLLLKPFTQVLLSLIPDESSHIVHQCPFYRDTVNNSHYTTLFYIVQSLISFIAVNIQRVIEVCQILKFARIVGNITVGSVLLWTTDTSDEGTTRTSRLSNAQERLLS